MSVTQLKHRIGPFRFTMLLLLVMVVMVFLGYRLARLHWHSNAKALNNAVQTRQMLEHENAQLRSRLVQVEVDNELARKTLQGLRDEVASAQQQRRDLEQQLAFYQRVMAPETTQDGFLVDGLQINPTASAGYYRASFVLLQQRQTKAVVKGQLAITLTGSQDSKPVVLRSGENSFMPDGDVIYRFKYFQAVEIQFQMPEGFVPEFIEFSTEVYQYTTKRGDYHRRLPWSQVYDDPGAKQPESTGDELLDRGSY